MVHNQSIEEMQKIEDEQKAQAHGNDENAQTLTEHIIGSIHTLHVKIHQFHWYVTGPHFFSLHEKFEELYNENEKWFDELAEVLLAQGVKVASTSSKLVEYSILEEEEAYKYLPADEMVAELSNDYRKVKDYTLTAIEKAADEGNPVLEDTLIAYAEHLTTNIWMLQAYLGKEATEDNSEYESQS